MCLPPTCHPVNEHFEFRFHPFFLQIPHSEGYQWSQPSLSLTPRLKMSPSFFPLISPGPFCFWLYSKYSSQLMCYYSNQWPSKFYPFIKFQFHVKLLLILSHNLILISPSLWPSNNTLTPLVLYVPSHFACIKVIYMMYYPSLNIPLSCKFLGDKAVTFSLS